MRTQVIHITDENEKYISFELYNRGDTNQNTIYRAKKLCRLMMDVELTTRQRECITMRFVDLMSIEAISSLIGVHPTTVYFHIRQGLKKLRKRATYIEALNYEEE